MKIIAYNLLDKSLDIEVHKILPQMLSINSNAEYYSVNEYNRCQIYIPTSIDEKEIEEGNKYTYYKINGNLYSSIWTNEIDYWLKRKQENIQITLF